MKIFGNTNMGAVAQTAKTKAMQQSATTTKSGESVGSFDQITLSTQGKLAGNDRTQQEVASKISAEVRTHNTTSKIAQLKEEVQNGTYQADARETAARMFLLGAVE